VEIGDSTSDTFISNGSGDGDGNDDRVNDDSNNDDEDDNEGKKEKILLCSRRCRHCL